MLAPRAELDDIIKAQCLVRLQLTNHLLCAIEEYTNHKKFHTGSDMQLSWPSVLSLKWKVEFFHEIELQTSLNSFS